MNVNDETAIEKVDETTPGEKMPYAKPRAELEKSTNGRAHVFLACTYIEGPCNSGTPSTPSTP